MDLLLNQGTLGNDSNFRMLSLIAIPDDNRLLPEKDMARLLKRKVKLDKNENDVTNMYFHAYHTSDDEFRPHSNNNCIDKAF